MLITMNNNTRENQKLWRVKATAPSLSYIISRQLGISTLLAQLLINRGIYTVEQARDYLESGLAGMHSPGLLCDLPKAVERIKEAIRCEERIMIYGDYDADGITATALLVRTFHYLGVNVATYIPNRLTEGYGLRLDALQKAVSEGVALLITVDCGISSITEAKWAKENELDLIITDHHEPPAELPQAYAVINPKRQDCRYPFKKLAGVGVALKLAQALLGESVNDSKRWQELLGFACIGTVADIVPLQGENRIIVKNGLNMLVKPENTGLRALFEATELKHKLLGAREIGYVLAPRLNAAGRMGDPGIALNLLLTDNMSEAMQLANQLENLNRLRQKIETEIFEEIKTMLDTNKAAAGDQVIVLASPDWHIGVIGIVASRLVTLYNKPVLLIAIDNEEGKGSARSIPGFNIYQALLHCRSSLLNFGGHATAAGFSIEAGRIDEFRSRLNDYARQINNGAWASTPLELDSLIDLEQVSEKLIDELDLLKPFGHLNPGPLLGCRQATVVNYRNVGRDAAHLKLLLKCRDNTLEGIGFNLGDYTGLLAGSDKVDLAFVPGINVYNGKTSIQIHIKELGVPAVFEPGEMKPQSSFSAGYRHLPTDKVTGDWEALFVPEFIHRKLQSVLQGVFTQGQASKTISWSIKAKDCRDLPNKPEALLSIVLKGEPSVVVTSYGYRTIELTDFLQLADPSLTGRVAFCNGSMPEEARSRVIQALQDGAISVLVTTPVVAAGLGQQFSQGVIYDLPYDQDDFINSIKTVRHGGDLYLLCTAKDLQENMAALDNLAPERSFLVTLYTTLRREQKKNDAANCTFSFIYDCMNQAGRGLSNRKLLQVSLNIFEELKLLN
jgi:single-stranded-DNA-specific exonuclease